MSRWCVRVTLFTTTWAASGLSSAVLCTSGSSDEDEATEAALLDPEAGRGPDGPGAADDEEAEGP